MKTSRKVFPLRLEFYLHGKKKIPSVSFIGVDGYGVPLTRNNASAEENAAFDKFSKAAYEFCKQIAKFEDVL